MCGTLCGVRCKWLAITSCLVAFFFVNLAVQWRLAQDLQMLSRPPLPRLPRHPATPAAALKSALPEGIQQGAVPPSRFVAGLTAAAAIATTNASEDARVGDFEGGYRGKYLLHTTADDAWVEGMALVRVVSKATASLLGGAYISLTLLPGQNPAESDAGGEGRADVTTAPAKGWDALQRRQEMQMWGFEFGNTGKLSASGVSDLGLRQCRVTASVDHSGRGSSRVLRRRWRKLGKHEAATPSEHPLIIDISTDTCGFELGVEAEHTDVAALAGRATRYVAWVAMLVALQSWSLSSQLRRVADGGRPVAQLSMVTVGLFALADLSDAIAHLGLCLVTEHVMGALLMLAMVKLWVVAGFEFPLAVAIWRAKHAQLYRSSAWEPLRQAIAAAYRSAMAVTVVGLLVVVVCCGSGHVRLLFTVFQLIWVPQVCCDAWAGVRGALAPRAVLGMSAARCLTLLHLWGCPSTAFDGELFPFIPGSPGPRFCAFAVVLHLVQLGAVAAQQSIGPRCIVPRVCLPRAYDYSRTAARPRGDAGCSICMGEACAGESTRRVATTPCDHTFHRECLQRWLEVKMECPTCRAPLPPM